MKIYMGYKFTGENYLELIERINKIRDVLEGRGNKCYGLLKANSKENKPRNAIYKKAFREISKCEVLFLLVTSEEKSEGQLIEAGYAKALNKKIIAAVKEGINTNLLALSQKNIIFKDMEDLISKLTKFKI